jgi:hypothetical protein
MYNKTIYVFLNVNIPGMVPSYKTWIVITAVKHLVELKEA